MAAQLGIDEATFRQLRALENRDIRPEDYDLLGVLDSNVKKKTLDAKRLQIFPTETYQGQHPESQSSISGFWYWQPEWNDDGYLDVMMTLRHVVFACWSSGLVMSCGHCCHVGTVF